MLRIEGETLGYGDRAVLADLRFEQVDLLQGTQLADLVGGLSPGRPSPSSRGR